EDGIRDFHVTGVQTCALPISADRLFGDSYYWSVLAAGRHQIPFATQAATIGGNVRVGLEDSLYIGRGQLARDNAEQVSKIRRIRSEERRVGTDSKYIEYIS